MGYLFLYLALAAGAVKGYCGKKTSGAVVSGSDSMVMNCLRMGLCVIIGFLILLFQGNLSTLEASGAFLWIAVLAGVSSAAFVVSWLLSVRSGAYMMVEVFLLLGVVVTIVLCRIFFGEPISLKQILGILLLLVAVYIMCTYNASLKGKLKLTDFLLPLFCGFSCGMSNFADKLFVKTHPEGNVAAFNLYIYLFAGMALLLACFLFRNAEKNRGVMLRSPLQVIRPIWHYVLIMAICLFANSFFKTLAASYLDAVRLYPLSQGSSVLISLFLSAVFFKEKINGRCIVGIALSFGALLMINL